MCYIGQYQRTVVVDPLSAPAPVPSQEPEQEPVLVEAEPEQEPVTVEQPVTA